jgi:dTDP-4-dehydrorhamnose 3,5-epimerase-like enzyme
MTWESPFTVKVSSFGNTELGYLNVMEDSHKDGFPLKRVYWTSQIPNGAVRGNHAHKEGIQLLVCLKGKIDVQTELPDGKIECFTLNDPSEGLLIHPHVWHTMTYQEDAIQLVMASLNYDESDYLRTKQSYHEYYHGIS